MSVQRSVEKFDESQIILKQCLAKFKKSKREIQDENKQANLFIQCA